MQHFKRQSHLGARYSSVNQNLARNSMMAFIFVNKVWFKDCGHLKKISPFSFFRALYFIFGAFHIFWSTLLFFWEQPFFLGALYFPFLASQSVFGALYLFSGHPVLFLVHFIIFKSSLFFFYRLLQKNK